MRKVLLGTAALIALAGQAVAADMRPPVYKAPPPVVPVWSWTGCYVGGHAGGLRTKQEWTDRTPGGDFFGRSLGGHNVNHWLGGVQAGCDYQFAGGFVIGIQADYAWTEAEGSHDSAREFGVAYHSKVKSLASGAVAPGSATITGPRRSSPGLFMRGARRGRDGPSVSAVNMPSPISCPASSNTAITISATPGSASRRYWPGCAPDSSISKRPRASCAPVSTSVSAVTPPDTERSVFSSAFFAR
jgi:opacity protein-like surface antigen